MDQAGEQQHDDSLDRGDGRTAEGFAEDDRAATHRSDHHLAQESELAVPHDRDRGEDRREEHRHREHAGEDERSEVDPTGARLHERR